MPVAVKPSVGEYGDTVPKERFTKQALPIYMQFTITIFNLDPACFNFHIKISDFLLSFN